MSTAAWLLILGFGLVKLTIALLMLWLPFRFDEALVSLPRAGENENDAADEDDGGTKTLPGAPRRPSPHRPPPRLPLRGPRGPRRGPHGTPAPPSPARSRRVLRPRRGLPRVGRGVS
jgi:hypothetical protein